MNEKPLRFEIDLCVDCLIASSNGPEDASAEWEGLLEEWDGYLFGYVVDDEGDPVEPHFSWSPCQGCGSGLGGDRHPHIAMSKDEASGLGSLGL
jgi:hypothetical protein